MIHLRSVEIRPYQLPAEFPFRSSTDPILGTFGNHTTGHHLCG